MQTFTRSPVAIAVATALGLVVQTSAFAGPAGGSVVDGQGTISTPGGGTTVIDQTSQHLNLRWDSFDVGTNETVRFNQPSSSAVAVNRILDQNPSQIFGRIDANGKVVLVNPNGLLIGRTAQINVGSLVASSLDAIDFDANGGYQFSTLRGEAGAVSNEGSITAAAGGSVTLLGGRVTNSGAIVADFGTVNLAAGRAATIDLAGDGLLRLEVGGGVVENSGSIQSNGGRVLLTAGAMEGVLTSLVNNTGVVRANRIHDSGGVIQLVGPEGMVLSSGTLDASAGDAVSNGGSVEMLGDRVGLLGNAVVDVSGATGGGTALIGGDYQGANPNVVNATRTIVSAGSTINADAGAHGDGGRIIVWADGSTRYDGSLSARGGALSGNGGFAEVSGKRTLDFNGSASLNAAHGNWGTLLLDPDDITIVAGSDSPPDLNNGNDANYLTSDDAGQSVTIGNLTIQNLLTTVGSVALRATDSITQSAGADIDVRGIVGAAGRSITLDAGGAVQLDGHIYTNNGAVNVTGTSITMGLGSSIETGGAAGVNLTANVGDITVTSIATSGTAILSAQGAVLNDGDTSSRITANTLNVTNSNGIGASGATGALDTNVASVIATSLGDIYLRELNDITLAQLNAFGGSINVTALSGDITSSSVSAALYIGLVAQGGRIRDDGFGSGLAASNGDVELRAGQGIGAFSNYAQRTGNPIRIAAANRFLAQVSSPVGDINLVLPVGATPVGAGAIRLGTGSGSAGQILLQSAGDLNTGAWDAQAIDLGPGNVSSVMLSGGVSAGADFRLQYKAGGLFSSRPGTLILHGSDIIDDDGTPHTLSINAGRLRVEASAPLAAKILNTTIDRLDLTFGVSRNLTVNQTGTLTLGEINPGAFSQLTIAANGAVLDDNDNTTKLRAFSTTLSGSVLGGNGNEIDVLGGELDLSSLSSAYVRSDGALQVSGNASSVFDVRTLNGQMDVGAVDAFAIRLETAGTVARDLRLEDVLNAHSGNIRLVSGGGVSGGDVYNYLGNASILGGRLDVIGATIGVAGGQALRTDVSHIVSNSTVGATNIVEANDVNLGSIAATAFDVRTLNGTIVVDGLNANTVSLRASGAGKDLVVAGGIGAGGLNNSITLVADDGSIVAGAGNAMGGSLLTLDARSIGSATDVLNTNVTTVEATASAGGIYLQEANSLNVSVATAVGGDVNISTLAGDLTVTTVAGGNISLAAIGTASDLTFGVLDVAPGGDISLLATDELIRTTGGPIEAGSLKAQARFIGASGAALLTDVGTLDVSSTDGSVYVANFNDVDLTANVVGGSLNVSTGSGAITVDSISSTGTGSGVNLTAGGAFSAINLDGLLTTTGDVTLEAGSSQDRGALLAGVGGSVVADDLVINAASIGGSGAPLNTTITSLVAAASGDIHILESDDLVLANAMTAGAVDVGTTNGSLAVVSAFGNGVTLTTHAAGKDINLRGTVNSGTSAVVLDAGGAIVNESGGFVAGDSLTASGTSIGSAAARLLTAVNTLDTTSQNGGTFITNSTAVMLDATAVNGAVDVESTLGSMTASVARSGTGGGVRLVAGGNNEILNVIGAIAGGNGDVVLQASGDDSNVSLGGSVTTTGDVTIGAGSSASRGAFALANGSTIAGDAVSIAARAVGANGASIHTNANSLNVTATVGGVYVQEADGLQLTVSTPDLVSVEALNGPLTVNGATGHRVTLVSGGNTGGIAINGAVSATDLIVLDTMGAITAGGSGLVTVDSLFASGSSIGSASGRLMTDVASIDATATNGGIYITETDGVTLDANATGGLVDVQAIGGPLLVSSVSGDGATLSVLGGGQDLVLNGPVDGRAGIVSLTANGAIVATPGSLVIADTLSVGGVSVGAANARLKTSVATLVAQSVGGDIYITEANDVAITANALGGTLDVETTHGSLTADMVNGSGVTLTANGTGKSINVEGMVNSGGGDISLRATGANGNIRVAGSVVTPGNVSLIAGTSAARGAIVGVDTGGVIANALTIEGASIGSSAQALNMAVTSLNATAQSGDIYVTENDDLDLTATANGGRVSVTSLSGALNVAQASSGFGVTLTSGEGQNITLNGLVDGGIAGVALIAGPIENGGAIIAGPSAEVRGNVLTAKGSSIGSAAAPLETNIDWLNGTATNGGIYIAEQNGLSSLNVTASGDAAGDIEIFTATGDLGVRNVVASDTVLLAAGGNIFALPSSPGVSARAAEFRAGFADAAAGQIGTTSDPLKVRLATGETPRVQSNKTPVIELLVAPVEPVDPIDPTDPSEDPSEPTEPNSPDDEPLNPALVNAIFNQPATTQGTFDYIPSPSDPNVRLLEVVGEVESALCLPPDQRRDGSSAAGC